MDAGSWILAIGAVGLLIIFHEAGHFWAARWSGMSVSRFSIGFGPPIAKFERNGTIYQIGLLPLGGFVQIDGLSPHDGTDPDMPSSYLNRPFHQKFAAILAGPAANYLLAFFIVFAALTAFRSVERPPIRVTSLADGGAAAAAGLQVEDLLVGVDGRPFESREDFLGAIQKSGGAPMLLDVRRAETATVVAVTPKDAGGRYLLGVGFSLERYERVESMPIGEAFAASGMQLWTWSARFVRDLANLVDPRNLMGPVGIVNQLSDSVSKGGLAALPFIGQLSVMLGIANLMPIPGLDGSRLLFLIVGLVRRKPIPPRLEAGIHTVGVILLLLMLVGISVNDVLRL